MPLLPADTPRQDSTPKAINEFIAQVRGSGMMRQNRFAVLLTPPVSILPENLKHVLLFCDSVQLPGTNFSTVQNRTYGEFREVPYEKLYDPCSLTFYVDGDLKVKQLFDRWTNQIQDPITRNFNYYSNYTSDLVKIFVEDLNNKPKYIVGLYEVYPKTVSQVQMGYDQKDVMKLSVSFAYKYWRSEVLNKSEPKPTLASKKLEITRSAQTPEPTSDVNSYVDANGNIAFNY